VERVLIVCPVGTILNCLLLCGFCEDVTTPNQTVSSLSGKLKEWEEWEGGGRPPILPLLPVLTLPRDSAMLRCQINRLNKTDLKEPYTVWQWSSIVVYLK
jgi:hypothetical protein